MTHRIAITALSALALAAPAAGAQAPDETPVAAGKLEHTVTRVTVSGPKAVPSDVKTDVWVSAGSSRSLTRHAKSGKAVSETADGPRGSFVWTAEEGKVRFSAKPSSPAYGSFAADAATLRSQVAAQQLVVTGSTTVNGRAATLLGLGPNARTSDPGTKDEVVVDARSYRLLSRTTTAPDAVFVQKVVVLKAETLELASNKRALTFSRKR